MAKSQKKKADEIRQLYNLANSWTRKQWEYVNQKGYDFAHDEQLTQDEKTSLDEQGMPTFTINRILPVTEMLNYYATANNPRWQAIGADGSDTDVAAVFSDMADYIWNKSDASTLYANCVNDAITKGVGYLLVTIDKDMDNGMGEVVIQQPEPFDVYIDPKSRDMLFRDAAFILIRKVLPKNHLIKLFPDSKRKIMAASSDEQSQRSWSKRNMGGMDQKLFAYNDTTEQTNMGITASGEMDELCEFFELYEKIKVPYINLFYRVLPSNEELAKIQEQANVMLKEMEQELQVQFMEQDREMQMAVQSGEMLPERYQLETRKAQEKIQTTLEAYQQQIMSKLQAEASKIENEVITEKEFTLMMKNEGFAENVVDSVRFHGTRIKQTCCAGDKILYEYVMPMNVENYPLIPFHFEWTGTPYAISAVAPLVGKQQEINKAHQIMVHNASLGSSLRWMYEEGSIDTEQWEKYSSAPGALLPIRPGIEKPTPVMPAPLSSAFFQIVQEGKQDMEYLAGIYSAMQGDTGQQHDTFRGMLALDEYGTRRIKQWMKASVEPALKQMGHVIMEISQSVYTANKRFRIIQPNAILEEKEAEINIPVYNDMGEAIGKSMDFASAKFDVKIIAGSTLPVNRWAYLEELKELMKLGVVDDIAVLAESDLRNKDKIVQRKSLYSQLQGQVNSMQEALKDKDGTIETLERQLVQAGIKGKIMQADVEINKAKEDAKSDIRAEKTDTLAKQKLLQNSMQLSRDNQVEKEAQRADTRLKQADNNASTREVQANLALQNFQKDLERKKSND